MSYPPYSNMNDSVAGITNNNVNPTKPINPIIDDLITKRSRLQIRNFNMEGLGRPNNSQYDSNMRFHVYYTPVSPIYYELMPFIRAMKFSNEIEAINMLPSTWIKHADDFNDPRFNQNRIAKTTKFIESQGIPMMCTIAESKSRAYFMQKMYDSKLKKIENDRIVDNNQLVLLLVEQITKLNEDQKQMATAIQQIKDSIQSISGNHNNIVDELTQLMTKI